MRSGVLNGSATGPAVRFSGVRKRFAGPGGAVHALRGVGFSAERGAVTGLIGPDGAGKTTLMRLAVGLLEPDAGAIEVLGMDADRDALAVQGQVGYMPQRFGLYGFLRMRGGTVTGSLCT